MLQELLHLFDTATRSTQMNNSMAIGAHWPHIGHRVHLILRADFRQWLDVVDVDEPLSKWPIHGTEVEATNHTGRSIVGDAASSSDGVTLIGVDDNLANCPFSEPARHCYLLGQLNCLVSNV